VRTRVKGILKYRAKGEVDVRDLNSDEFHSRKPIDVPVLANQISTAASA
jgi:hypothetical protein